MANGNENEIKLKVIVSIGLPTVDGYDQDQYEKAREMFIEGFDQLECLGCKIHVKRLDETSEEKIIDRRLTFTEHQGRFLLTKTRI